MYIKYAYVSLTIYGISYIGLYTYIYVCICRYMYIYLYFDFICMYIYIFILRQNITKLPGVALNLLWSPGQL